MRFKKSAKTIITMDPYYDLFEGGYIKPYDLLKRKDAEAVTAAVALITEFFDEGEEAGLLEFE